MNTNEVLNKLKAEIEKRLKNVRDYMNGAGMKYKGSKYFKAQGKESSYDALLSLITSLQQVQEPTCETCGFYENNCPFIRGKLIPYPNKVCKDYTYSEVKAQEQPTKGYDEAYLNECIAKASKTWEGVDADKYLDDVRGREQEQPEVDFKIEERKWVHDAVDNIFPEDGDFMSEVDFRKILKDTARHFYELGLKTRKEE